MNTQNNIEKSKVTLKNYKSLENSLTKKFFKNSMEWVINNPKIVIPHIENLRNENNNKDYSDHSKRAYFKYILIWSEQNISETVKNSSNYIKKNKKFKDIFDTYSTKIMKAYEIHEFTEKQEQNLITTEEFLEMRKKIGNIDFGSPEHLLLSMYSYIPPARADYDSIYIYIYPSSPESGELNKNYIIENEKGMMKLYLHEFKTVASHKVQITKLPSELTKIIKNSLEKYPRNYLFVTKQNVPYPDAKQFDKWANRVLFRAFNRNLTLGKLRNIKISDLPEDASNDEKIKLANSMMHSQTTQHLYRKKIKNGTE